MKHGASALTPSLHLQLIEEEQMGAPIRKGTTISQTTPGGRRRGTPALEDLSPTGGPVELGDTEAEAVKGGEFTIKKTTDKLSP